MDQELQHRLSKIQLIGFDVDGVFTDGRFYLADDGTESKAFNTQDGYGIRCLLEAGVEVVVISGRRSQAVEQRMQELRIRHAHLGCKDKVSAFHALANDLGLEKEATAFVGDDIPDLALLKEVGVPFAVGNATAELIEFCAYTTSRHGGMGAIREICDMIIKAKNHG